MNRHTKIAIFVAPFLTVLGYVLSDFYLMKGAERSKIYTLKPEAVCEILTGNCILSNDVFKLSISDRAGVITINSTLPMEKVVLFLVDKNNQMTAYPLNKVETRYYWQVKTPLRKFSSLQASGQDSKYKLRLIASMKDGEYISEFYTLL